VNRAGTSRSPGAPAATGKEKPGRILGAAALLALTASCAGPPPNETAPVAMAASVPASAATATTPPAPQVAALLPPAADVAYVPLPLLWARMLTGPPPAGRLMLNNFGFDATRIQAVLVAAPVCAVDDPGAVADFVLPSNGTRVLPAPPGFDICWRRQRIAGEPKDSGRWTPWNRAVTGPGRFLDVVVLTPAPPDPIAPPTGPMPALPATLAPDFPMPNIPPAPR
jgi:hypothetical protein